MPTQMVHQDGASRWCIKMVHQDGASRWCMPMVLANAALFAMARL